MKGVVSLSSFIDLFMDKKAELLDLFLQHMNMTTMAVFISLLIGVPVGILITRNKAAAKIVIGVANIMQSIPCIALLAFSIPFVGIGEKPAILMVIVYALLPIIKNTYTGIIGIDPKTIEMAKGLGITKWKRLFKVELPIAAPFIMSGIRISAVAAVGTMTIAAFAGAGGLGWYINLGLNSRNTMLVLLGAIPASVLALLIDFLLGKLEHALTSEGLLPPEQIQNIPKSKRRTERWIVTALCAALVLIPAAGSLQEAVSSSGQKKVVIGTSNFTEALILGYMYADLIESGTDITVEQRFNLNGASVCFDALDNDKIDMFIEYTGTILSNMLKRPIESKDPDVLYEQVKTLMEEEHQIHISAPLGYNNTYVMSVMPETAEKYQLKTLSDLMAIAPDLRLGCTVEFVQREDCLDLLKETFGTDFKEVSGLDASIRYEAIEAGEVDVIDAFATDALLPKAGLVKLEDDVQFFPPYYAVNLVRDEILEQYPELESVLSKLDGAIDAETMAGLNAEVDISGRDAKEVAHDFLAEKGLV